MNGLVGIAVAQRRASESGQTAVVAAVVGGPHLSTATLGLWTGSSPRPSHQAWAVAPLTRLLSSVVVAPGLARAAPSLHLRLLPHPQWAEPGSGWAGVAGLQLARQREATQVLVAGVRVLETDLSVLCLLRCYSLNPPCRPQRTRSFSLRRREARAAGATRVVRPPARETEICFVELSLAAVGAELREAPLRRPLLHWLVSDCPVCQQCFR